MGEEEGPEIKHQENLEAKKKETKNKKKNIFIKEKSRGICGFRTFLQTCSFKINVHLIITPIHIRSDTQNTYMNKEILTHPEDMS